MTDWVVRSRLAWVALLLLVAQVGTSIEAVVDSVEPDVMSGNNSFLLEETSFLNPQLYMYVEQHHLWTIPMPQEIKAEWSRLKHCRHGFFVYPKDDIYVGRSLDRYGEWAEPETSLLLSLLRAGDTVVEVGANFGTHTVPMANRVGKTGMIYAIEHQRIPFQLLNGNVALNGIANTFTLNAVVEDGAHSSYEVPDFDPHFPQNYLMVSMADDWSKISSHEWRDEYGVDGVTFTTKTMQLDDMKLKRCRLMRIDAVELASSVITGAMDTLNRFRPLLYFANVRVERRLSESFMQNLKEQGYSCRWFVYSLYQPDNFFQETDNVFGHQASANILCWNERGAPLPPKIATQFLGMNTVTGEVANHPLFRDPVPSDE